MPAESTPATSETLANSFGISAGSESSFVLPLPETAETVFPLRRQEPTGQRSGPVDESLSQQYASWAADYAIIQRSAARLRVAARIPACRLYPHSCRAGSL
jgi:hypothetical protein